jgi:hypothetical protein
VSDTSDTPRNKYGRPVFFKILTEERPVARQRGLIEDAPMKDDCMTVDQLASELAAMAARRIGATPRKDIKNALVGFDGTPSVEDLEASYKQDVVRAIMNGELRALDQYRRLPLDPGFAALAPIAAVIALIHPADANKWLEASHSPVRLGEPLPSCDEWPTTAELVYVLVPHVNATDGKGYLTEALGGARQRPKLLARRDSSRGFVWNPAAVLWWLAPRERLKSSVAAAEAIRLAFPAFAELLATFGSVAPAKAEQVFPWNNPFGITNSNL